MEGILRILLGIVLILFLIWPFFIRDWRFSKHNPWRNVTPAPGSRGMESEDWKDPKTWLVLSVLTNVVIGGLLIALLLDIN